MSEWGCHNQQYLYPPLVDNSVNLDVCQVQ